MRLRISLFKISRINFLANVRTKECLSQINFGSSSGRYIENLSSWSLLGLSQTARRLGEIKPGPVFGKGYRQPGGKFQQEKQMPPIWLLSVENIEGMPERLVKWRFTLLSNVYSHSRFVLSTNHLRWLFGFKKWYLKR